MTRQAINPDTLFNSVQYGFSQITVGTGSRIVTISGQVAWNAEGHMAAAGDLKAQTIQSLANLDIAIQAAGGTLDNILSLRLYVVAMYLDTAVIREALAAVFPTDPPTATWIGVQRLANKDFLIEIEALAVLA
jgi:enamine deaminase RidA (YjgF/YER057c/UK114 family)